MKEKCSVFIGEHRYPFSTISERERETTRRWQVHPGIKRALVMPVMPRQKNGHWPKMAITRKRQRGKEKKRTRVQTPQWARDSEQRMERSERAVSCRHHRNSAPKWWMRLRRDASVSAAHSSQLLPPPLPFAFSLHPFSRPFHHHQHQHHFHCHWQCVAHYGGKRLLLFQQQALLVSSLPSVIINCSAISADAEAEAEVVCVHFCHRVRLHFARLARHFGIVGVLFSPGEAALVPCRDSARVILICSCCSVLGFCWCAPFPSSAAAAAAGDDEWRSAGNAGPKMSAQWAQMSAQKMH